MDNNFSCSNQMPEDLRVKDQSLLNVAITQLISEVDFQKKTNVIRGTDLSETIYGTYGDDTIFGYKGDDVLFGKDGNDTIYGGEGNDIIYGYGYEGDKIFTYLDGNDFLYGGPGNDTIYGDDGNDYIDGGPGFNILNGGKGDDIIVSSGSFDILYGGDDNDIFRILPASSLVPIEIYIGDFISGIDKIDFSNFSSINSLRDFTMTTGIFPGSKAMDMLTISFNNFGIDYDIHLINNNISTILPNDFLF